MDPDIVAHPRFPDALVVGRVLGRGSNNKVFSATLDGAKVVLRAPRRRSDTQHRESALWEYRYTKVAAELGVAPRIHEAWIVRHAQGQWTSGLYMICEHFPHDLDDVICKRGYHAAVVAGKAPTRTALQSGVVACLQQLAQAHCFVFDLKPSNFVVRYDPEAGTQVRMIDFGHDFCEWAGHPDCECPHVRAVEKLVRADADSEDEVWERVTHVLFATMLAIFSATTTCTLYDERHEHGMDETERAAAHPTAQPMQALLASMQNRHIMAMRSLLRMAEVRTTLKHYHSRRNGGTNRTLHFAQGFDRRQPWTPCASTKESPHG